MLYRQKTESNNNKNPLVCGKSKQNKKKSWEPQPPKNTFEQSPDAQESV